MSHAMSYFHPIEASFSLTFLRRWSGTPFDSEPEASKKIVAASVKMFGIVPQSQPNQVTNI